MRGGTRGYRIYDAQEVRLIGNTVLDFDPDSGDYAFFRLVGINYLTASANIIEGVGRPFYLDACPNAVVVRNDIIDQTQEPTFEVVDCPDALITLNTIVISVGGSKEVLDENGGSDGMAYRVNVHHAFTATEAHTSTGTFQLTIPGSGPSPPR